MKKTFQIEDLCCANCAAKMEDAMRKLPGVHSVNVAFLAQKVVLEAEDDRFDDIARECAKICRRIEPDCELILK
jgi:copper chaperone CopZ